MNSALVAHLLDGLNLLVRWFHLIAGIAWIGSSFYFIWLDSNLEKPKTQKPGVEGELWMVHSGGFYQVEKRRPGPGQVPENLHWFKWEATLTWISGFFLLGIVYYLNGGIYLLDPAVSSLTLPQAIACSLTLLAGGWLVYDLLWQSPLAKKPVLINLISFALLCGTTYALTHLFSGRAAYLHVGALLGTLMVLNVWVRILPAQTQMIAATQAGKPADFSLGEKAKRRSVHNSYMTFPVIFIMLSNHYPSTYGHPLNGLVLILLTLAGAGVRHAMISKSKNKYWVWAPTLLSLLIVMIITSPRYASGFSAQVEIPTSANWAQAKSVIDRRCISCHSAQPIDDIFKIAPVGVVFDTPESVQKRADRILVRVVQSKTMPLGNKTQITEQERGILGAWIQAGAPIE